MKKQQGWLIAFNKEFLIERNDSESFDWKNKNRDTLIFEIKQFIQTQIDETYKNGYNQCLKDQKLTGEKYQGLYL